MSGDGWGDVNVSKSSLTCKLTCKRRGCAHHICRGTRDVLYEGGRPNVSYSNLIAQAICASPEKRLSLKEIYGWIMKKYPFYQNQKGNWQNSIRHNLSLNKAFYRVAVPPGNSKKGSYWCFNPNALDSYPRQKGKKFRVSDDKSVLTPPPVMYYSGNESMSINSMSDCASAEIFSERPSGKSDEDGDDKLDADGVSVGGVESSQCDEEAGEVTYYTDDSFLGCDDKLFKFL